jgi:hypothetical protein
MDLDLSSHMEGTRLLLEATGIRKHDLPSPLNI